MTPQRLYLEAPAFWAPALPGWAWAAPALRGQPLADTPTAARPAAALLAANERRRAPDGVLLALEVAQAAVAASGRDARTLPSVFSSAHGDQSVVDGLCSTLASNPLLLSPTRFHHSVHNAGAGYWALATGSHAANSAVAGYTHSWATGWLEAATQASCEQQAVLLVGSDTQATGPLASVNRSRGLLALAVVLAPTRSAHSAWAVDWAVAPGSVPTPALHSAAAQALADNAMADGLPLFEALATLGQPGQATACTLRLPLADEGLHLLLTLQTLPAHAG